MDLPFLSMFPKNCCEIASLILGKILIDEYPEKEILMIKAERTEHGRHFWLKAEGKIFDITADQFEKINSPIIGADLSPLTTQYKAYEISEIRCELEENDFGIHIDVFSEISKIVREKHNATYMNCPHKQ